MADFDRDTDLEETPALVAPRNDDGEGDWWELDDWGDEG